MSSGLGSQKIQVGIRIRPLTAVEIDQGQTCSWLVRGQTIQQIVDQETKPSSSLKKRAEFKFQYVFGPETSTNQVYDELVAPIVQDGLIGINGAICCYGQTSAVCIVSSTRRRPVFPFVQFRITAIFAAQFLAIAFLLFR